MDETIRELPLRPARKPSTYDPPPTDPIALVSDIKPVLRRATTLQSFIEAKSTSDPFPGRLLDEPEEISADHDAYIHELDALNQKYDSYLEAAIMSLYLLFGL